MNEETQVQQPQPLAAGGAEPIEKLSNLADACLEVHKSSADPKEARKNFRQLIQQAYLLGQGKELDPKVVNRPEAPKPKATSASTFKPREPLPTTKQATKPKPADPKKVSHDTGKGAPAKAQAGKTPAAKAPAAPAPEAKPAESQAAADAALETF